jgi:uncharacterized protein (DUF433 family)
MAGTGEEDDVVGRPSQVLESIMDRITIIPGLCGGRPTIRGLRIAVSQVLEMLAEGMTEAEILEAFPFLEADDIRASLRWARVNA